ncbi:hypothetical protein CYK37_20795 [Mesorhizobium loti]|nr:AraC family transcriptional regulator [Mesorhizobium loti]PLP57560.1 hypothetical protein CYK37_20795 [Mesorhizobium loti]
MLRSFSDGRDPTPQPEAETTACRHTPSNSIPSKGPTHIALVLLTPGPSTEQPRDGDLRTRAAAPAGTFEIIPASGDLFTRWRVTKEQLLVGLVPDCLIRLAGADFDEKYFEFYPPKPGTIDRYAHTLAQFIAQELETSALGAEDCLDALHTLFSMHVLRNYSSLGERAPTPLSGGLTPSTWRKVHDFIQAHLTEPLPVERLASVARLSPSHFARAFRKTAGQSPHNYIVTSRLTLARDQLIKTKIPLNQIATDAGFSSHSHMTAMMRQLWGKTPVEYRRAR